MSEAKSSFTCRKCGSTDNTRFFSLFYCDACIINVVITGFMAMMEAEKKTVLLYIR